MTISSLIARLALPAIAALAVLPAAAFQGHDGNREAFSFSAPEIETALASSAILVAAGVALILRDRKARRQKDQPE